MKHQLSGKLGREKSGWNNLAAIFISFFDAEMLRMLL